MRLAQHREAIRGIQEHLLEMPTQEELRALRDRADVVKAERNTLRATIRTMGQSRRVFEERIQSRMSHRQDREGLKKLEDFMTSQFGYRP
ncbi:hypothetical protein Tco_0754247 [Tanacetum coccineum]